MSTKIMLGKNTPERPPTEIPVGHMIRKVDYEQELSVLLSKMNVFCSIRSLLNKYKSDKEKLNAIIGTNSLAYFMEQHQVYCTPFLNPEQQKGNSKKILI